MSCYIAKSDTTVVVLHVAMLWCNLSCNLTYMYLFVWLVCPLEETVGSVILVFSYHAMLRAGIISETHQVLNGQLAEWMQGEKRGILHNRREDKFCNKGNKRLRTSLCPKRTFIRTHCWGLQDQDYLSSASKSSKLGDSTKSTEYTALEGALTLPTRRTCPSCHRRVLERQKAEI